MPSFRVPFGATYEPGRYEEAFEPGAVLATAAAEVEKTSGSREEGTRERTFETPWGELKVEARGTGDLVTQVPHVEVPDRPVMLQAAARALGIEAALVENAGQIQVVDVGRRLLVVPFPSPDAVRNAPEDADVSSVPAVDAEAGIVYAQTQRSPYVKLLARTWGDAEPLTAVAAAGVHLVLSGGFRPTYPRTRIVGQLVNHGEERCEVTVAAEKVGGEPKITDVLVGGKVHQTDG